MNEEEFENLVEKIYPWYRESKERARFYFKQGKDNKPFAMKAPDEYNQEHISSQTLTCD